MGFLKRFFKSVLATAVLIGSMTFASGQTGVAPNIRFLETDQTLPDGLWRIRLDGDVFSIQKNINASNNFATEITALSIAANGDVTIPQDFFVTGSATVSVDTTVNGQLIIDSTNTEALLIRQAGDTGDVLVLDTVTGLITIGEGFTTGVDAIRLKPETLAGADTNINSHALIFTGQNRSEGTTNIRDFKLYSDQSNIFFDAQLDGGGYTNAMQLSNFGRMVLESALIIDSGASDALLVRFDGVGADVFSVSAAAQPLLAFGTSVSNTMFLIDHAFISGTNDTTSQVFQIASAMTGVINNNTHNAIAHLTGSITTHSGIAELTDAAQLLLDEPDITINTATVLNAATLMISGAPSEGTGTNNALYIKSGSTTLQALNTQDLTIEGITLIDVDSAEAFLVRRNNDAGDIFTVNTINGGSESITMQGQTIVNFDNDLAFLVQSPGGGTDLFEVNTNDEEITLRSQTIIDFTQDEVFLVRMAGDTGDVFIIDTTNDEVDIPTGVLEIGAGETVSYEALVLDLAQLSGPDGFRDSPSFLMTGQGRGESTNTDADWLQTIRTLNGSGFSSWKLQNRRGGNPLVDMLVVRDTAPALAGRDQADDSFAIAGNLEAFNTVIIGAESIQDRLDLTTANWAVAGDFSDGTTDSVYLHSGGSGTLTQINANLLFTVNSTRWYRFTYNVTNVTAVGSLTAQLNVSGIPLTTPLLDVQTAGNNRQIVFKTATNADVSDFIVSATSNTAGDGFSLNTLGIREMQGGDVNVNNAVAWGSDVFLVRDEPWALALRDGNFDNTFRIYDQFTDLNNYMRLAMYTGSSGNFFIEGQTAGTGDPVINLTVASAGDGTLTLDGADPTVIKIQSGGMHPDSGGPGVSDLGRLDNSWKDGFFGQTLFTGLIQTTSIDVIVIDAPNLVAPGQQDSGKILMTGLSHDGSAHDSDWLTFVDVTSNAGASTWTLQTRIDAAGFATLLSVTDGGVVNTTSAFSVGTTPATTGSIRLPVGTAVKWRNDANDSDINMFEFNDEDTLFIGEGTGGGGGITLVSIEPPVEFGGALVEFTGAAVEFQSTVLIDITNTEALLVRQDSDGGDIFLVDTTNDEIDIPTGDLIFGGTPSNSGRIRLGQTDFIGWRNLANGADILIGIQAGTDRIVIGGSNASGMQVNSLGPHSYGGIPANNNRIRFIGNFTSGGAGTDASNMLVDGSLTGFAGDTVSLSGMRLSSTITTQGTAQAITDVAQLILEEPTITIGVATVTNAATLMIQGAPSEGVTTNNSLFVKSGLTTLAELTVEGVEIIDVDSAEAFLVRANGDGGDVFDVNTLTGEVTVGSSNSAGSLFEINAAFTGNVNGTESEIFSISSALTGNTGMTSSLAGARLFSSITTQAAAEVIPDVAQLILQEPNITIGTATVTNAATLMIQGAPTEGTYNTALLVKSGKVLIGAVGTDGLDDAPPEDFTVLGGDLEIVDPNNLSTETLQDGDFSSFANWNDSDDWNEGTLNYTYLHSVGSGQLVQSSANQTKVVELSRWWKFTYTVSASTSVGALACFFPSEEMSLNQLNLNVATNGTRTIIFEGTEENSADFIIECTSDTGGDGFTLDDVTLKEVIGGNIIVAGKITGGGTGNSGLKLDGPGNATFDRTVTVDTSEIDALLIRKGNDTGDVFAVDSNNERVLVGNLDALLSQDAETPPEAFSVVEGNFEVMDTGTVGSETITDGAFPDSTNWAGASDWSDTISGNTTYTHSGGTGTLTQTAAQRVTGNEGENNRWYRLTYTVSAVTNVGANVLTITNVFAGTAVTLDISSASTRTVIFQSNSTTANTGDFVLSATSDTASDTFTLDDLILVEIQGGNVIVAGKITGGGTNGVSIDSDGNTTIEGNLQVDGSDVGTSSGANLTIRSATAILATTSGTVVTATNLIPAGSFVVGVVTRVNDLVVGPAGYDVGDGSQVDRWGNSILVAADTTSDITDFQSSALTLFPAANDVVITSDGADFSAGNIRVIVYYMSLTAPTVD